MMQIKNALQPLDVPKNFRDYVEHVLAEEWMGDECEDRLYGLTPLGQHFVFVTSKTFYYAIRLIADEEHRDLPLYRQENVHSDGVVSKQTFLTLEGAFAYRNEKYAELSDGVFTDTAFRIRKLPHDCLERPHKYLLLGDHIQRKLDSILPGNHEGVYIGNGKVAHINNDGTSASVTNVLSDKRESCAIITTLSHFVTDPDQEIRVVVHCFRRKTGPEICTTARDLVNNQHGKDKYHIFSENCQHFANHCVIGEKFMTDQKDLTEKGVILAAAVVAGLAWLFSGNDSKENDSEKKEEKKGGTVRR